MPCRLGCSRDIQRVEHEEFEYEKPGVKMKKVLELQKEIGNDIQNIQNMLK